MIQVSTPSRICLFGEHQDYLGLEVIASAINLRFSTRAEKRSDDLLKIRIRDKSICELGAKNTENKYEEYVIDLSKELVYESKRDYFKSIVNVLRKAGFTIPGAGEVKVAVVSGLGNARRLMNALGRGEVSYDFVEVMACPGGCAGGGGQPIHDGQELAGQRGEVLWRLDKNEAVRFSHENPDVQALYRDYLEKPLSEKSHQLLHTDHFAWEMPKANG